MRHARGRHGRDKLGEPLGVALVHKEKVEPIAHLLQAHHVGVRAALQNQLLHIVQRALVAHAALPQLHLRHPRVRALRLVAVGAVQVLQHVLDNEALLQDRARAAPAAALGLRRHARARPKDLLLHRQLQLQPLAVRLRPHKARVHQLHLAQPAHLAHQHRQQLPALGRRRHPRVVVQVPAAPLAPRDRHLLRDALCHVHLRPQTRHTHVRRVCRRQRPAHTAQNLSRCTICS